MILARLSNSVSPANNKASKNYQFGNPNKRTRGTIFCLRMGFNDQGPFSSDFLPQQGRLTWNVHDPRDILIENRSANKIGGKIRTVPSEQTRL